MPLPVKAFLALGVSVLAASWTLRAADGPAIPPKAELLATMERVADWQIAHDPADRPRDEWVQAAGYTGIMALAEISASPRFDAAMMKMAEGNHWKDAKRPYHADDQCVSQTYIELYFRHHDKAMLAPTIQKFDYVIEHPMDHNLEFVGPKKNDRWAWCDSLFMAPPGWLRLTAATGDKKYLDYTVAHWWETSDYLYDKDAHLYYRDSTYFKKREANGEKVFWSRGNGWVLAGLARVLPYLPKDHPSRPRFEQQFREMAAKVITLQQPDGFWHSSLLDPKSYPAEEESGTGFFCFGLLWGINNGLLDRSTYLPVAMKAWAAISSCVQPDGKVIHVQPIGSDPKTFDQTATEPYGVGAYLLAGRELYRMAGGN